MYGCGRQDGNHVLCRMDIDANSDDFTDEENCSDEDADTDDELQKAFAKRQLRDLKGGLVRPLVPKKTYTNNVSGLQERLAELQKRELDWLESMSVVTALPTVEKQRDGVERMMDGDEEEEALDVNDDFKREMHFVHQAQSSVKIGLEKLRELDVPFSRPDDYFAEMVKNDDHMRKVKEHLMNKQNRIEAAEKSRKLRELRKFGKKVQQEVLQQRQEERKSTLQAIKKFTKGKGEKPAFLTRDDEEDDFPHQKRKYGGKTGGKKGLPMKSKKRQMKDHAYGFGGKKRGSKRNTAISSADMSSFSSARHGKAFSGKRKGQTAKGAKKRPGKERRMKTRQRQNK